MSPAVFRERVSPWKQRVRACRKYHLPPSHSSWAGFYIRGLLSSSRLSVPHTSPSHRTLSHPSPTPQPSLPPHPITFPRDPWTTIKKEGSIMEALTPIAIWAPGCACSSRKSPRDLQSVSQNVTLRFLFFRGPAALHKPISFQGPCGLDSK